MSLSQKLHPHPYHVELEIQGNLIKSKVSRLLSSPARVMLPPREGNEDNKRGKVNGFSTGSRFRLLQMFARLSLGAGATFITLTYAQQFPHPRQAKRDIDVFIKRLKRLPNSENMSGVWRLEFQERGAPHYHLIIFNMPFLPKQQLRDIWAGVIDRQYWDHSRGFPLPPFTRIEYIFSRRLLTRYVSKHVAYVAKDGSDGGKRGFNLATYLTVDNEFAHPVTGEVLGSVGRWWGVFGRDSLPFAELIIYSGLPLDQAFYTMKRYARRYYSRLRSGGSKRGFSLFIADSSRWRRLLEYEISQCESSRLSQIDF